MSDRNLRLHCETIRRPYSGKARGRGAAPQLSERRARCRCPPVLRGKIIQAFYGAIRPRPETTFGNVKADVLAGKDPSFQPDNFCWVIRASAWPG
jgi:hypothetical protein